MHCRPKSGPRTPRPHLVGGANVLLQVARSVLLCMLVGRLGCADESNATGTINSLRGEPLQPTTESVPSKLSGCFAPPAEFLRDRGPYRSSLVFKDGTPVRTPQDWTRRRREILAEWTGMMGSWPANLEHPRYQIICQTTRNGCRQQQLRLQVAKDEWIDAWLLIPHGRGPFPAALVPYYDPDVSIAWKTSTEHRDFGLQLANED